MEDLKGFVKVFIFCLFLGAVDGHWSNWGGWSSCTEKKYCNLGTTTRKRSCTNPAPNKGGDDCEGSGDETKVCPTSNCRGKLYRLLRASRYFSLGIIIKIQKQPPNVFYKKSCS